MSATPDFSYQRFDARSDARSAFDTACETTRSRLVLYDRDEGHYGLARPEVAERFEHLLRRAPDTRIELLLQQAGDLIRNCPRLIPLMLRHGERFTVRPVTGQTARFSKGLCLFDQSVVLRRPELERMTTLWDTEEDAIRQAGALLDEIAAQAGDPLSPIVTGL
jgi:hypothetical protein